MKKLDCSWTDVHVVTWHKCKKNVWSCTTHIIGTWNVKSINQGKVDIIKEEEEHINATVPGMSEPKWTGIVHFQLDNLKHI